MLRASMSALLDALFKDLRKFPWVLPLLFIFCNYLPLSPLLPRYALRQIWWDRMGPALLVVSLSFPLAFGSGCFASIGYCRYRCAGFGCFPLPLSLPLWPGVSQCCLVAQSAVDDAWLLRLAADDARGPSWLAWMIAVWRWTWFLLLAVFNWPQFDF